MILWLTGNCDAGKTGLAKLLKEQIANVVILDGDEMRRSISTDCDFSLRNRITHNYRVAKLAVVLSEQGFFVVVSVIAPFENIRRDLALNMDITWVYVQGGEEASMEKPYMKPDKETFSVNPKEDGFGESVGQILHYLHEIKKL